MNNLLLVCLFACTIAGIGACGLEVDEPRDQGRSQVGPPPPPTSIPPGLPHEDAPGPACDEPDLGHRKHEALDPSLPLAPAACAVDAGGCAEPSPCFSHDDCAAGLCVNAQCQAPCKDTATCAQGEACVLGLCRPSSGAGWGCRGAADCSDDEDCVGGTCFRRCLRDEHCVGCDEGHSCSLGYCGL